MDVAHAPSSEPVAAQKRRVCSRAGEVCHGSNGLQAWDARGVRDLRIAEFPSDDVCIFLNVKHYATELCVKLRFPLSACHDSEPQRW